MSYILYIRMYYIRQEVIMDKIIKNFNSLEINDIVTICISCLALLVSSNASRKNNTRIKLKQTKTVYEMFKLDFDNILGRNNQQSKKLWNSDLALYYLCITLEVRNLSHADITLGNFKINKTDIPNSLILNENNITQFNGGSGTDIQIYFRDVNKLQAGSINLKNIKLIYPQLRLKSKSTYIGTVIITLQGEYYNMIKEGNNVITIETPDKKFKKRVKIKKTS